MNRLAAASCLLLAAAVGLGAFGAHALKASLTPEALEVYKTGNSYHALHSLGLVLLALAADARPRLRTAWWLIFAGTLIFGATLYILSVFGVRWMGAITPIGGVGLIAGWTWAGAAFLAAPAAGQASGESNPSEPFVRR